MIGGKQLGFSEFELTTAKKKTKREKFLAEMEAVVSSLGPSGRCQRRSGWSTSGPAAPRSSPCTAIASVRTNRRTPRFKESCHPTDLKTRGLEDITNAPRYSEAVKADGRRRMSPPVRQSWLRFQQSWASMSSPSTT